MADDEAFYNPVPWRAFTLVWADVAGNLPVLRAPSALLGAWAAGWVALAAGRRAGTGALIVGGVGMAATPWMVRQQAQFRGYGLAVLAAGFIAIALLRWLERPTPRRAAVAGVAAAAGGWAHFALLPWIGVWAITACGLLMARRIKPSALLGVAAPVALIAAGPVWLAWRGLLLKQGDASASMAGLGDVNLLWRPEPIVALVGVVVLMRQRSWPALALAAAAAVLGVLMISMAASVRTMRWGHLVLVAPALWLTAGIAIGRLRPAVVRMSAIGMVAVGALMVHALIGAVTDSATRLDDVQLAAHLRDRGHARAWIFAHHTYSTPYSRPHGVLYELGYYGSGPDRCVGADRVHELRCRARVEAADGRKGVCLGATCVWPVDDAPEPLAIADRVGAKNRVLALLDLGGDGAELLDECVGERWSVGRWRLCHLAVETDFREHRLR